jgi:hypothetical protein
LALVGLTSGCVSDLDTTREPVDNESFGTTVVTLMCKRMAHLEDIADGDGRVDVRGDTYRDFCRLGLAPADDYPDSLKALSAKRDLLIDAVDATFPEGYLPDLQTFLTTNDFLALYDDATVIDAVDALIEMMRFMADDPELAPALERLNHRIGYLPTDQALGAVRAVVNYPDLHQFLVDVVDQVTEGGQAKAEFDNLLAALGVTLRNAEATSDPADPTRTGQLALELLLSESDLLATGTELPMVRRDFRGVAMVSDIGTLNGPFVDMDADGLADVDADGRFVDETGSLIAAPAPFELPQGEEDVPWPYRDATGRALEQADGDPLYDYVDIDQTLFAALARDAIDLFDPQKGTALDMLRGASALMSNQPRMLVTRQYDNGESLEYRGYDLSESPLLDMLHGYLTLLRDPDIYDVLDLARTLLTDHEAETSRLLEAVMDAKGIANKHPEAEVDPMAPLADDLIPVVRDILAVPGLAQDLMRALEDPAVSDLGMRFRDYMKYSDQFTFDADQNLVGSFSTEVERTRPDRAYDRSLMQRLLHLISDSNGASMCNKQDGVVEIFGIGLNTYDECQLVQVDNLAVFYVQSIAYRRSGGNFTCDGGGSPSRNADGYWRCGDGSRPEGKARFDFNWGWISFAVTDSLLQDLTTIDGFKTRPTPEALNRTLFLDPTPDTLQNLMDPAETKYGQQYKGVHAGTLPVWEADNFYDQIQPIVQAFADHDAEQLFVDLLSALHKHWPSKESGPTHQFNVPGSAGYVWGSNARSYEAAIVEILERRETLPDRGNILDALHAVAPVINGVDVGGKSSVDVLTDGARYVFAPQAGLTNRQGETSSETIEGDAIDTLSPIQLLLDAYSLKRQRLAGSAAEGEAWQQATGNMVDVLLRGKPEPGVGWQFRNPRFRGISVLLIDFVEQRLRVHDQLGDRDAWVGEKLPSDLEDLLSGPVFAGAADFILSLQASPEARQQIEALTAYLMNEVNYNEAFKLSLSSIADVLQLALDDRDIVPIAHVLGEAVKPERRWIERHLEFVQAARRTDEGEALVRMMRNLYDAHRPGHTAIGDLIDGISEVHRARPYVDLSEDYKADDYRALLHNLADFLDDEKRGLRRFISIIEGRNL